MYTIQTLNKISQSGLALFGDNYTIQDNLEGADAVLVRSAKMHDIALPSTVKAIARAGAGVNNIPIEECAKSGIVVFNTPGANANAVKELVLAGLLLSSRKVVEGINWAKTLDTDVAKAVEKGKGAFVGPEILGKKLGVIGLGAIGVMVANSAQALGMEVIGHDPYISINAAWGLSRHVRHAVSLDEVLAEADYITVHVPLVEATKYMFNKEAFSKMKPGVRLLNFSRDTLVHNGDLLKAIEEGIVTTYVTDFPVEEVMGNPNILTIPHLGASTPESEENCAVMAVQEVKDYLENGNIVNSVNYPECIMAWASNCRLAIIHKNTPAILGKITAIIAGEGINIRDMSNRSRGDFAYTLIDTDTYVSEDNLKAIENMEHIIKVRLLVK
ncbi:3-phosphoglycerate dehydrogenase [Sporanaerobium hydrogeniformans]|uniref:3-phosphoglycerate dehydrogenase n=1 Tax=Sporanaerobium hydrogeniformans TaxID=3072179 RepID=A0AC61DFG1_9FIRM|nr:phosphoglycerate dehydrogenase [Sporanaerobium hydrogeniformans]PHV71471.1 3-phosphoglycerate dehydrogenase [Sporanaerobium hydrogeniformans]